MGLLVRRIGFLTNSVHSPLAWLSLCLHGSLFLAAIANMSPPSKELAVFLDNGGWSSATLLAGRPFHWNYESTLLKVMAIIDLPSLLAIKLFSIPVRAFSFHSLGAYADSYVASAIWLVAASIQWLLVGAVLQMSFQRWPAAGNFIELLRQNARVIILLILLCTAVAVPLINARSRQLGFRHGGISFGPGLR